MKLLILKRRFGLSIQALLRRLRDLETIGESQYKWWFMFLSKMKWRRDEPEPIPPERATWLKQAVHRCIAEGFLTVENGGKILGEKLEAESGPGILRRKAFLKLPLEERRRILEAQAEKLQKHYEEDEGWKTTETDEIPSARSHSRVFAFISG
jgi:DNA-binding HxlR family transcriptional regulator